MDTQTLCRALLKEACDDSVAFYRQMLNEEALEAVKEFARQAALDALSTFCGGIDGSDSLDGKFLALSLTDADGQQHAGRLQETLLALAERK
jgi:hypothetical protein